MLAKRAKMILMDDDGNVIDEIELKNVEVEMAPEGAEIPPEIKSAMTELDQIMAERNRAVVEAIRETCLTLDPSISEEQLNRITAHSRFYVSPEVAAVVDLDHIPFIRVSDRVEPGRVFLVIDPRDDPFHKDKSDSLH